MCAVWVERTDVARSAAHSLCNLTSANRKPGAPAPPQYGQRVRTTPAPERLSPLVFVWRAAHGAIAIGFLASIGYIWSCALARRRGPCLRLAVAAVLGEGVLVVANDGDCPLGPLGDRIGDEVPLFELVLSPRAARRAIPVLGAVTAVGLGVLAARPPAGVRP